MRCTTRKCVGLLVLTPILFVISSRMEAKADTALLSFSGGFNATSGGSDQLYGWEFNVLSTVNVTALGVQDENSDGLSVSHDVGIFRVSDQSLLTSTTVSAGTVGTLDNGFRYSTLGSALTLTPDQYVIVMTMPDNNADLQSILNTSVTTAPQIQYVTSTFDASSTLAFPNPVSNGSFAQGLFGPNFQFTTAAAVPEPSSLALLVGTGVTGAAFLRRRKRVPKAA